MCDYNIHYGYKIYEYNIFKGEDFTMKRIVLVASFIVIAMVLFMLPVSAEAGFGALGDKIDDAIIPQCHIFGDELHGSEEHCDGWYNENCARVLLKYVDTNGQEQTVTYPTYYVLENDSTLTWNFERLGAYLGVELSVSNVVSIEIPYGVTEVPRRAFVDDAHWIEEGTSEKPYPHATESTTLKYVSVPNSLLTIGDYAFAHCTSLAEFESETLADHEGENDSVEGNHNHQMIQSIGYRAFHDCPLTTFNFNKHLVHLSEGAFEGCHFTKINLSKCIELKVIPAYCFHENDNYHIDEIILSASIEEIGDYAFTGSSASYIFLGTSLKKIGKGAIAMSGKVELLVIPATITELSSDSITTQSNDYTPVVVSAKTTDDVDALMNVFKSAGSSFKFAGNAKNVLAQSLDFLADTTLCTDFLGGHMIDPTSNITDIIYKNGIGHEGIAYGGNCIVCQQATEETTVRPILISKGYSVCTYGDAPAFVNGFEIYTNALKAYESVYGECEIGVVFLTKTIYDGYISEGMDLRENISLYGACLNESEYANTTGIEYSTLDFVVKYSKGIGVVDGSGVARGDEQLVISAYMLHKDETKAYKDVVMQAEDGTLDMAKSMLPTYYVQDQDDICIGGETNDKKYLTVSYNSIYGYIASQDEH